MLKRCVVLIGLAAASLAVPSRVDAGPKEEGLAVLDRFLAAFTASDADAVVALFAPDALFWGTTLHDLAATRAAVRRYFDGLRAWKRDERKASALGSPSAVVVSDDVVLVSGLWSIEVAGQPTVTHRVSLAVVRRGGRWLIAQFHNSPRPPAPRASATR